MTAASPGLRASVLAEARRWLGTPFVHGAQVLGSGVGCGGLLIAVYGALGVPVPAREELGYFPHDWHLHERSERYLNILLGYTREVSEPEPGDIALFRIGHVYAHSAIVEAWPRVIHTMWKRTVEWADADKPPLARRKIVFLSPFE